MPVFTATPALHPSFGRCFELEVLLPNTDEVATTVRAYVSEEFQRSVISPALAERLGCTLVDGLMSGLLVIESRYEGAPLIHRSQPIPLKLRLAHHNFGDAYLHLALPDLSAFLHCTGFKPRDHLDLPFLAFHPTGSVQPCIVLPIER